MAKITPNFDEAVDMTPPPPGEYKARIINKEDKVAQKSGAAFLRWELHLFGGEGEAAQYNGRKVYHNTMLSGPGSGIFRSFYMAAWGIKNVKDVKPGLDLDTDDFLSKEIVVTLVEGMRDGQPTGFAEVKAVKPITAAVAA